MKKLNIFSQPADKNKMRLILFFPLSNIKLFLLCLSLTASFTWAEPCTEPDVESSCGFKAKKINKINKIEKINKINKIEFAYSDVSKPAEGAPANCDMGLNGPNGQGALSCCTDPTSCLGGESLSAFHNVNNFLTQIGPGISIMLQGMGKDMSGICQGLQGLAGTGASLSLIAAQKCNSSISACHKICDYEIRTQCEKYIKKKQICIKAKAKAKPPIYKTIKKKITDHKKKKTLCTAQKVKSKTLLKNMGQMANAALSAELCKRQARADNNKKECKKKQWVWRSGECNEPESEPESESESEQPVAVAVAPLSPTGGGSGAVASLPIENPYPENPSPEEAWDETDEDTSTTTSTTTTNLGGGGKEGGGKTFAETADIGDIRPLSDSFSKNSASSSEDTTTPENKATQSSSKQGGGFSGFRGGRRYYNQDGQNKWNDNEKEDSFGGMGGGGFSGYGGNGFGWDEDQAGGNGLGLSKKKLNELKKKQGTKRTPAGQGGGAHQSIFERVSKRFHSLCQHKLDCR